jgi:hypothetical protein
MQLRLRASTPLLATGLIASLLLVACTAPAGGTGAASASVQASIESSPPVPSGTPPTSAAASPEESAVGSPEPTSDLGPFSCDFPIEGDGSTGRAQITDVRVGEHDGYDRIVFEFDGGIPQWTLQKATKPYTQDPSGLPMDVQGDAAWLLTLQGGTGVGPDGSQTYTGGTDFVRDYAKLVELVESGDFEAVSTWYVGMTADSCARVLLLDDPARLVVDIEH